VIPSVEPEPDLDIDGLRWFSQEPTLDIPDQFDAILDIVADVALSYLSHLIALEAYLNAPHVLFPGESDPQGIGITEYPFE
jgi:hypothetical protein